MRIAVPVRAGSLTPCLASVDELSIVDVDLEARQILTAQRALVRATGAGQLVECLTSRGVDLVIVATATDDERRQLGEAGIGLRHGAAGTSARDLIKELLREAH